MLNAHFTPLPKWDRLPALQRRKSFFKQTYMQTLDLLEYEIGKVQGRDIRIEAGFTLAQLRNDGWPRTGERPAHPGVVVYFENDDGALAFPAATFAGMHANLHAIALTLECLRAVDRYGVTLAHEQYRGFLALPAPATRGTVEQAAILLASYGAVPKDFLLDDAELYKLTYRKIAAVLHPDAGGDRDAWEAFQNAAVLLEKHHAGAAGH
jgi:hypothetical protein